jgi:hypothetical protein
MRTAQEIYEKYRIMPSLQLHQLRVAAVAQFVCEHFAKPVEKDALLLACLFHDMGNIIKADLGYFPEFVEPEGREYWERVKEGFISKYGANHHRANVEIARELGLPQASITLIDTISFSQIADVVAGGDRERKIMQYADLRVGPRGVLSLRGRLAEGKKRYTATRTERPYYDSQSGYEKLARAAEELERQIFAEMRITSEDITDASIRDDIEELRNYKVA